jgi:hypothetical protein
MCPGTSNLGRALETAVSYNFPPDAPRSTISVAVLPFSSRLPFALWSNRSKRVHITPFAFLYIRLNMQRAFTSRARASALSASKLRSVSLQQQRFAHKVLSYRSLAYSTS